MTAQYLSLQAQMCCSHLKLKMVKLLLIFLQPRCLGLILVELPISVGYLSEVLLQLCSNLAENLPL
jgi:hypothetical protein